MGRIGVLVDGQAGQAGWAGARGRCMGGAWVLALHYTAAGGLSNLAKPICKLALKV